VQCDFLLTQLNRAAASPARFSPENTSNTLSNSPNVGGDTLSSSTDISAAHYVGSRASAQFLHVNVLCPSQASTLQTLWRTNVPQVGFSYDFVMRGILALSALYLAYFRAEKRDHIFSQAILQNQTGLRAATSILRHVTDENRAAVYIFTVLTCIYTLASPRKLGDLLVMGESGSAESLALFRGIHFIMESSPHALQSGVLGPMFIAGWRRSQLRKKQAKKGSTEEGQLGELRLFVGETSNRPACPECIHGRHR
jgi:hypothetical protein